MRWLEDYCRRQKTAEEAVRLVKSGNRIYVSGNAATPYIVHYTPGWGRHQKDGVRIAVGSLEWTRFVALPGPNDEVRLTGPILAQGLSENWAKILLAEEIARPLRVKLANTRNLS